MPKAPLFRDPIYDGAADPALIWNREAEEWWIVYTNRRASLEGPGVAWVHGTDLGIASSRDQGETWTYRGILQGLEFEEGRNTFWAPEILWHDGVYHMYVSYIQGVPVQWEGHKRQIIHYTSNDLWNWTFQSILRLSSEYVIDACVHQILGNKWRMWYKDEAAGSFTYAADSDNLYHWQPAGPVLTHQPHEGANVFYWNDTYWMVIDEWSGLAVYQSAEGQAWHRNGKILHEPGTRDDDQTIGLHADVHVNGKHAYIFYFTHPDRDQNPQSRRSSLQAAKLELENGKLICSRNASFSFNL
ncbi:glycoside hydrolase family protein [Domibacillus indicus]|uniref:glycosyl hydrolase n=1 Tax=Domibacillus indicus TaxID=1437523 RepID=UPI000617FE2A|nr:glycosyl hydrolase [Domibacillus indicus]